MIGRQSAGEQTVTTYKLMYQFVVYCLCLTWFVMCFYLSNYGPAKLTMWLFAHLQIAVT